ncbi:TRAFAC clade GTPase domain-containing protein [Roseimaritima sediminicola]|uniref:TRAFAC clade GTPase domain-containing protein n=1 Tax=Roseimaritima sediminicola TaxID=2662066 RepID=UPI00129853A3|nr:hypothetical protein [Roseimaritima sediminicola]
MITTPEQLAGGCPPITVYCACCDQRLADDHSYCSRCLTPASLSRTVASRSGDKSFLSVLGASGAGKTVYLGLLLDILSNAQESFRGTTTSPFTIALQEQVVNALEHRRYPEKTPAEAETWKWVHCQLTHQQKSSRRYLDLISPDLAGEAIAMEIEHPGTYPAVRHTVLKSAGVMLLCDSLRVRDAGSSEDLFALKLASYIAETHAFGAGKQSSAPPPALAVVFTKSDACPEATEAPERFAANNTPRLAEFCKRTFDKHAFFAASVAGNSGTMLDDRGRREGFPLHIQPQGVIEPLRWLVA